MGNIYWRSPSKSFFWFGIAFLFGIGIAHVFGQLAIRSVWIAGSLTSLFCLLLFFTKYQIRFWIICLFCVWIAFLLYQQTFLPPDIFSIPQALSQKTKISGVISGEVIQRSSSQEVVLDKITLLDRQTQGRLLVWLPTEPQVFYGDHLTFHCEIQEPNNIGIFRFDRLLESRGIYGTCSFPGFLKIEERTSPSIRAYLFSIKDFFIEKLRKIVPEPHATFISGLLFGGGSSFSRELREDFSRTGTSHILAASGYNVALFSQLLLIWLSQTFLGKRRSIFIVSVLMVVYVFLAGATAPVVRAGIMGLLVLVGSFIGRKAFMRNILLFTACLMLIGNPRLLFDDVGFQLSFLATTGLIVISPKIASWFSFIPEAFGIQQSFIASLAATITTLPILIWHFGSFSLIAPLVNLIVLPWIPYLMFFGITGIFISLFSFSLAILWILPGWALSFLILHIVSWLSFVPFASVTLVSSYIWAIGIAFIEVWFFWKWIYRKEQKLCLPNI
ncbi:hypothetical protein CO172_01885 [Candidatus Uhrbacteria bacterium CG_4_9_14_3_um_filter_36_7]|uniref:ComEC/Rec2-related protein domain-containing protein n=1 Tax=Candidatus Uhrbacteria bacterium CG_4_9_14_3_um_filter_36_7 TaxID=1975033 RepID=A0A2M7XHJ7_9BACT|nr:MAG: hypothetical protein CO172_01885 [Candidatus Uhrbacteria bacterium CG_4_9_14_3_um_filter_36_7]